MKDIIDRVKDYLKGYFYVDEIDLPYNPKDGRILFFTSIYKVQEAVTNLVKEQIKEEWDRKDQKKLMEILNDVSRNPPNGNTDASEERKMIEEKFYSLKNMIAEEERMETTRILEKKLEYSRGLYSSGLGKTKGLFMTIADLYNNKGEEGLMQWQKIHTPHLALVGQGIYVQDRCCCNPPCGYCGDYLILSKGKKDDNKTEEGDGKTAEHLITMLDQNYLMDVTAKYIFGEDCEKDHDKVNRLKVVLARLKGKDWREIFNAKKVVNQKGVDLLEDRVIYKNIAEVSEKEVSEFEET